VSSRDTPLARFLGAWVRAVRRRALAIVVVAAAATAVSVHYAANDLGINTDTADMISRELEWRETFIEYKQAFPQYSDTVVVVVDAPAPDFARQAADALAGALEEDPGLVRWVYRPGSGAYFRRNGLLYLDVAELEALADDLAAAQPFLARLSADPSLRGLSGLLAEAVDADGHGVEVETDRALARVAEVVEADLAGRPGRLSWHQLFLARATTPAARRQFLIVKPRLDYGRLFPAEPVVERVRALAAGLEGTPDGTLRVRVTGGIALEYEELKSVSRGAGLAALAALVLVAVVLAAGLRSWRLVVASLVTLVAGLTWTAAFATLAVGHLNLISVAFAVLYIGLGVAYAVHYCLRHRELVRAGVEPERALEVAAGDVGGSLVLCAATTGIGFFAFVPTDFAGVSELGLISGTGMFISLLASLTLLPALLALLGPRAAPAGAAPSGAPGVAARLRPRARRAVLAATAVAAAGAALALPATRFDHNPLNLRDPTTESVSTFRDLMDDSVTAPWTAVVLAGGAAEAAALAARLEQQPAVEGAISMRDFVPAGQEEKLRVVDEMALLLGTALDPLAPADAPSPGQQLAALGALHERLARARSGPGAQAATRLHDALGRWLERLARRDGQAAARALEALEARLLGTLPDQLARLRQALRAERVTLADLPADLVSRWVAADGRWRVEVLPAEDLDEGAALERFVAQVRAVAPDATGAPVTILESGAAVVSAFQQAFVSALVLISLLLALLFRRARDVALVLAPLLLAGLLTVATVTVLGIPFNFANVIALPLLLGVGVDNGIHMVNRMRIAPPASGDLLRTSTARAVVVSALTTICSFGNLAFSSHRGTASMGQLLTIGLAYTLVCTLVLLPVVLEPRTAKPA